jgi:two-component system OmpR family sensor kinase
MKLPYPPSIKGRLALIFIVLGIGLFVFLTLLTIRWLVSTDTIGQISNIAWLYWSLLGLAGVAMLVAGGYLIVIKTVGPIDGISQRIQIMVRGGFSQQQIRPSDPIEVQNIIRSLNRLNQQVEARVEEMRSFVANASHELRTPLTAVKLRVEALRAGALEDASVAGRFLGEIESEIDRLSKMVNDLLDLTQIEAGMTYSPRGAIDFAQMVKEVCASFSVRAERSGINLSCRVEDHLPDVLGVEEQLRRVAYNLVDNGLKYTPNGGEVDVYLTETSPEEALSLTVRDTGFGISPGDLPHIFERFYRVEATRPRYGSSRGSGLGLPIVKMIVERHGGKIKVKSEVGHGSEFTVELPVTAKPS